MYQLPKPFYHLWCLGYSSLTMYPGLDYDQVFLVHWSLLLLPMGSILPECSVYWIKLIANGCNEYHKEYYWSNTSYLLIKKFCHHTGNILFVGYMSNYGFPHCNWFIDCMIANRITFLSENWFWSVCIVYTWHIVPIKLMSLLQTVSLRTTAPMW